MGGTARNNSLKFYNDNVLNSPEPLVTTLPKLDASMLREKSRYHDHSDDDVESGSPGSSSTMEPLLEHHSRFTFCGTPLPPLAHVRNR